MSKDRNSSVSHAIKGRKSTAFAAIAVLVCAPVIASAQELTGVSASGAGTLNSSENPQVGLELARYEHELLGSLVSSSLREASGLAISTLNPGVAWVHNDSGYGPYVFAFSLSGEPRGRFYVEGARSSDWEDIDTVDYKERAWLLVADTGDNQSRKPYYSLYLIPEPVVSDKRDTRLRPVRDMRSANISFPGGPADTEAIAVDEQEQRVYLITKRLRPALVYSVPLSIFDDEEKVHVAKLESNLFELPAPSLQQIMARPKIGLALSQPNALDFSPDRSFAVVHTYGHSYLFERGPNQSWAEAFESTPTQVQVPNMQQGEAVAVGLDSSSLYYTSEGKSPPLYRLTPKAVTSTKSPK